MEPNIDLSQYGALKAAGTLALTKPLAGSANYVLTMLQYDPMTGKETTPIVSNINRQTLADLTAQIQTQQAAINNMTAQIAAITADMNTLG